MNGDTHKGSFWDDGNVFLFDRGVSYTEVWSCQVTELYTLELRDCFTACILYLNFYKVGKVLKSIVLFRIFNL